MVQNQLANCITLIRNGLHTKKHFVVIQKSVILYAFLNSLQKLGYILSFSDTGNGYIKVFLRYNQYGQLVLRDIKLLSTKSRRLYINQTYLKYFKTLTCNFLLSTTKGYLTHHQAIKQNIGGELICYLV